MKPDPVKSGVPQSARRRLVRGVFGAPAVLALYSGSARATSSLNVCMVNQNASPTVAPVVNSHDGLWLRYQLWAWSNGSTITGGFWISASELNSFNRAGNTHWLTTSWVRFSVSSNALVPADTTPPTSPGTGFVWGKVNKWAALQVNANGRIVGAGATGGASSVSASCWNSFAAGTAGL